jgi:mRNA (guanine-N7-)-methyltransferase
VTEEMIYEGKNIPESLVVDDSVYYNMKTLDVNNTQKLRDFHNLHVKKVLIDSVSKSGFSLIDYACGKAGDLPKWVNSKLSFVFGVDVSKDNLENRKNGACARYIGYRATHKNVPGALFVNGNSSENIRSGEAMMNPKAKMITRAVFGDSQKDMDPMVAKYAGVGLEGFDISSCQFAIHYFFKTKETLHNFLRNVSECTRVGGHFIGTCYDGGTLFNELKAL